MSKFTEPQLEQAFIELLSKEEIRNNYGRNTKEIRKKYGVNSEEIALMCYHLYS